MKLLTVLHGKAISLSRVVIRQYGELSVLLRLFTTSAAPGALTVILNSMSKITLPADVQPYASILDFLTVRFPHVRPEVWAKRVAEGKVLDDHGVAITPQTQYAAGKRIFYHREVEKEPVIPFAETIIFQNDHLLVACKPHFLPVNPTGPYVEECLLGRLRRSTGNQDLVPINRIDRETAGLVLFSADKATRDHYCRLFREGKVEKSYQAIAEIPQDSTPQEWLVENRMVEGEPWFRMKSVSGEVNARSIIELVEARGKRGHFVLHPITGKTHQLRLHMSGLGFRIVSDRYYPDLQPQVEDDFHNPLQLLAKRLRFLDPLRGEEFAFESPRRLKWEEGEGVE
jgi:tRNA pseudouridine32 synthase / 23S rRNA pseudouridine746 synthase